MFHRFVLAGLLASLMATVQPATGFADPVDSDSAREQLFRANRVEVLRYTTEGLTEAEIEALTTVAQAQKYYAALAFAPAAGIIAEPTVMAANYHSLEAARAAALAECDQRRSRGAACVIALEVRPQGWQARDLQLSADATRAFNDDYRRARGPRAFATSASTGSWGIGRGEQAAEDAISACQGEAQGEADVSDCAVVIAD